MVIQDIRTWLNTTDRDYLKRFFGLNSENALIVFLIDFLDFIDTHCFSGSTNIQKVFADFNLSFSGSDR